jgi:predicted transcriptional regulator
MRHAGISLGIIASMAMTLRLDDNQANALRARADLEGVSMQAVAVKAIEEYIERHSRQDLVDQALDRVLPTYAEALRRLGE